MKYFSINFLNQKDFVLLSKGCFNGCIAEVTYFYDMKKHNDERIKNLKKKRLSKTEKDKKIREKIYSNKTARRKRNLDGKRKSKTFKKWYGLQLSDQGIRQVYMGPGIGHGFYVLSQVADLHYKVSKKYNPNDEGGLRWDDPDINIKWPIQKPILSDKDRNKNQSLKNIFNF